MKLSDLKQALGENAGRSLRFRLPGGEFVPAHAHVTEVARIDKHFVDCGGTRRVDAVCRLQTWVAGDLDHRLSAGKLLRILEMAAPLLVSDSLDVDVEHETTLISQYPLGSVKPVGEDLVFELELRHTACLAPDRCIPPAKRETSLHFRPLPNFS